MKKWLDLKFVFILDIYSWFSFFSTRKTYFLLQTILPFAIIIFLHHNVVTFNFLHAEQILQVKVPTLTYIWKMFKSISKKQISYFKYLYCILLIRFYNLKKFATLILRTWCWFKLKMKVFISNLSFKLNNDIISLIFQ